MYRDDSAGGLAYPIGMDTDERIAQWENMTQADPTNDMGWFSLGSAYRDAGRDDDAQGALGKAIELNPAMSRAYQLRGQALVQLGREDEAAQVLTAGYKMAAERGDVMPQRAMGSLLEKIGRPVPEVAAQETAPAPTASGDQVVDRRTGQLGARLPDPPMRGALGQFIYDHYSQETWREWIAQGTKVINELRLDFSNVGHQRIYDQYMMEFLGITEDEVKAHAEQA